MVRVGVDPTRRTTKNSKRTNRPTVKNWGTDVTAKVARKTHRTSRGSEEKTLVQEVLELAEEMIDGMHLRTKTDLEPIEIPRNKNATGKSSRWSLLTSVV